MMTDISKHVAAYLILSLTAVVLIQCATVTAYTVRGSVYILVHERSGAILPPYMTLNNVYVHKQEQQLDFDLQQEEKPHDVKKDLLRARARHHDKDVNAYMNTVDCVIMGRHTFDKMVQLGEETWNRRYGNKKTVVWTRNPQHVTDNLPDFLSNKRWPFSITASSLPPKELLRKELLRKGYMHACVDGNETIKSFMKEGLIHSLRLAHVPTEDQQMCEDKSRSLANDTGGKNAISAHRELVNDDKIKLRLEERKEYPNGFMSETYDLEFEEEEESMSFGPPYDTDNDLHIWE